MCTELLPPGGYPTAVNKIYHIISNRKALLRVTMKERFLTVKGKDKFHPTTGHDGPEVE
jgi:hypothetical protein